MITKLKRRFIILAMVSLTVLLSAIVAGMNIMNYNSVVSNADETLEVLSENRGRMPVFFGDGLDDLFDDIDDMLDDWDDIDARTGDYSWSRGGRGHAPGGFSRDEAEETRYFTVLVNGNGKAVRIDTDRIYAVDQNQAAVYAENVIASGSEKGFVEEYRYAVTEEGKYSRVTFLDCGRTLGAFRDFLKASLLMSLLGLLVVFAVICYFAGRIVRPVAESYDKQKQFITDAGHEIKTPLTVIKANLDLMRMDIDDANDDAAGDDVEGDGPQDGNKDALSASLLESIDDIDGQVDRLTSLTNDLVYLSRMEESGSTLTMTEIPVSDLVAETTEPFGAVARERNKELDISIEPMLSMQGSSKEIEKLVSILMENALKYSPEGDRIGLTLRKDGRNIVLEVRNHASTPLSEDDLAHVFDKFYRADKSRNSAVSGHGIGLSMASAIVGVHGGKIRARSGDGSEFIVTATMPAIG